MSMMKFETKRQIEYWLEEMNNGHFDNMYENCCDMYDSEVLIVDEFNNQINFFLSEACP